MCNFKDFLDNKPNKELKNIVWYNFFKDSNIVMENPKWDWVEDNQVIERKQLGLFFWERSGHYWVKYNLECYKDNPNIDVDLKFLIEEDCDEMDYPNKRDFLDCVACLGEDKVKELIKELEEKE